MRILVASLPTKLDFTQPTDPRAVAFLAPVYSQLLQMGSDGAVAPDLAWHWEIAQGGTLYTFHLRPGARFHDGAPLTARDVRASLEALRRTELGQALMARVADIRASDSTTLVMSLGQPQASLLSYLALEAMAVVPAERQSPGLPPGSGPFRPRTAGPSGDRWELARNPGYYLPTRPYLNSITFQAIEDGQARLAAFRSGQGHLLGLLGELSPQEAVALKDPGVDLLRALSLTHYAFLMNTRYPPWDDPRVRQAASWAVQRGGFSSADPFARIPGNFIAPGTVWTENPPPHRDLYRARRLLAAAGYADSVKVRTIVPSGLLNQEIAFLLKGQLAEASIDVEPLFYDEAQAWDMVRRIAYQSALLPLAAPVADPDYLLGRRYITGAAENYTKYSSPLVDELFLRQSQALDGASRRELVAQMERQIMEDAPAVVLWWRDHFLALRDTVRNFPLGLVHPGALGNLSFQDVWLEEE